MSSTERNSTDHEVSSALASPVTRRWRPRVVASLGGILMFCSLPFLAFIVLDQIDYQYWPADGVLEGGQAAHVVDVGEGETFLLWRYEFTEAPQCSVTEVPSGESIELKDVSSDGWFRGSGPTYVVGFAEGRSDSARISVSCARTVEATDGVPEFYYVDKSNGPPWLDSFGPLWPIPVALLGGGLMLLAAAAVLRTRTGPMTGHNPWKSSST